MTLLRRAPREVYRVYSEEEFLADPLCDERIRTLGAATGGRRLNRIAGATLLVAAAGAVGGLIAWTSAPSIVGSRRRERQRTHSAVASIRRVPASRPQVWSTRGGGGARPAKTLAGGHAARRRGRSQPARQRARPRDLASIRAGTRMSVGAPGQDGAPSPQTPRVGAVSPAATPPAVSAVAVAPSKSDQTEFGFER